MCMQVIWLQLTLSQHQNWTRISILIFQNIYGIRGWYPCRTKDICQVLLQNVRYIFHIAGQCLVLLFHKYGNDRSLTCTFYWSPGHLSCTLFYGYQPLHNPFTGIDEFIAWTIRSLTWQLSWYWNSFRWIQVKKSILLVSNIRHFCWWNHVFLGQYGALI